MNTSTYQYLINWDLTGQYFRIWVSPQK